MSMFDTELDIAIATAKHPCPKCQKCFSAADAGLIDLTTPIENWPELGCPRCQRGMIGTVNSAGGVEWKQAREA